jgi:predicted aldo/keto reductase-like oxidoreductase
MKNMTDDRITRRKFVKDSSLAAAGIALTAAGCEQPNVRTCEPCEGHEKAKPETKALNYHPKMRYRKLGKSNLMVSELSLGGHWKNREGHRYWATFADDKCPEDVKQNRTAVVSKCIELGINYVDLTTPAEALAYGEAVKGRRDRMYIGYSDHILCMRNPKNRTVEAQMREIDEGLRRLQSDYIDIFRPQADMQGRHTDEEIVVVVEAFEKAKKQGKVRWLGMSAHNGPFLQHVFETFPEFTMVIMPLTPKSKVKKVTVHGKPHETFFQAAKMADVGVVTIKPFGGGSLFRHGAKFPVTTKGDEGDYRSAALAIRKILSEPGLTATVPGRTTIDEVERNVKASWNKTPLTAKERADVEAMGDFMYANLPHEYQWLKEFDWV